MLSSEKFFIFIHIPKTGGNSVQRVLAEYSEDTLIASDKSEKAKQFRGNKEGGRESPISQDGNERFGVINSEYGFTKHSKLSDYKAGLLENCYKNMYKFSILRNPWDRAISFYFSPHRGAVRWDREAFIQFLSKMPPVRCYIKEEKVIAGGKRCNTPLDEDINFLLKYENLTSDFKVACAQMGIDCKPLPSLNKNSRKHYSYYYDDELKEMVVNKFLDEIEFGGYEFDSAS
jgi:hypothetical protein